MRRESFVLSELVTNPGNLLDFFGQAFFFPKRTFRNLDLNTDLTTCLVTLFTCSLLFSGIMFFGVNAAFPIQPNFNLNYLVVLCTLLVPFIVFCYSGIYYLLSGLYSARLSFTNIVNFYSFINVFLGLGIVFFGIAIFFLSHLIPMNTLLHPDFMFTFFALFLGAGIVWGYMVWLPLYAQMITFQIGFFKAGSLHFLACALISFPLFLVFPFALDYQEGASSAYRSTTTIENPSYNAFISRYPRCNQHLVHQKPAFKANAQTNNYHFSRLISEYQTLKQWADRAGGIKKISRLPANTSAHNASIRYKCLHLAMIALGAKSYM